LQRGNISLNTKYKNKNDNNDKGFSTLLLAGKGMIESRIRQWYYFVGREKLTTGLLDGKRIPKLSRMQMPTHLLYHSGNSQG